MIETYEGTGTTARRSDPVPPVPSGAIPASRTSILPAITSSEIWETLSPDQQRAVALHVSLSDDIRSGNEVASRLIDLEKRYLNLDATTKNVIDQIDEERNSRASNAIAVQALLSDANSLATGGNVAEAILKLDEALALDPNNFAIEMRRTALQGLALDGDRYEGQSEVIDQMIANAQSLSSSRTADGWTASKSVWVQIKALNPRHQEEADNAISEIDRNLRALRDDETAQRQEAKDQLSKLGLYSMIGGGVLLFFIAIIFIRNHTSHRQLMKKIHEITSVRPMRELEMAGAAGGALPAAEGVAGLDEPGGLGSDLFSPDTAAFDAAPGDPLAGLGTEEPPQAPLAQSPGTTDEIASDEESFSEMATGAFDTKDIFASIPEADTQSGGDGDVGTATSFEDVFSDLPGGETAEVTQADAEDPDATETSADFDVEGLFGGESEKKAEPKGDDPLGGNAPADLSGISFGAISIDEVAPSEPEGPAEPPASVEEPDDDAPLSIFDESDPAPSQPVPEAPETGPGGGPATESDPFGSTAFDEIFSEEGSGPGSGQPAPGSPPPTDESSGGEVPAMDFEIPDADPFAGTPTVTEVTPPDLGSDEGPPVAESSSAGEVGPVFNQNFENDSVGERPSGWEGEFDYATLTVRDDDPPEGTSRYVSFQKSEGDGKAYFRTKFPNASGVVSIEFDLRCNNKNKYLLGFFIEKDEDFQQSIHTKILRPESSTAPQLLLQGEKASYLMGSWVHIKFVVNLKESKVDGYFHSTHIVRGLHLPQAPPYFNTLAFRDNINTTGDLSIANIQVNRIG